MQSPRRSRLRACRAPLGALLAIVPAAAWADIANFLDPLGPIARFQRLELIWASVLILIAVLPVLVGAPWILWRYRRSNRDAGYAPGWSFNTRLEIAMWGVPVLIVIALGIWLTQATVRIDPYREIDLEMAEGFDIRLEGPPVAIDTVGLDWKWLHIYPDEGIATVGELVVPVDRPVTMRLTTDTVMQSFMAPGLAGQIYAMPGMVTRLNFIADRVGETFAENTQYNGPGFAEQRSPVRAVPRDEYILWTAAATGAPPLDERAYARLAASGTLDEAREAFGQEGDGPLVFTLPDRRLFLRIVARYVTGEAIAPENQPGSPVYDPETASLPDIAVVFGENGRPPSTGPASDAFAQGGICGAPAALTIANLGELPDG